MRLCLIFFFLWPALCINAQIDYEKRADEYYKVNSYERALKDYLKVLNKKSNDADILDKVINCMLHSNNDRSKAMVYIERLQKEKPNHKQLDLYFAKALFHGHLFDKAAEHLEQFKAQGGLGTAELKEVERLSGYINQSKDLIQKPQDLTFVNLGERINTERSELNPFVTPDERVLFYTSDKRYLSAFAIYDFNVCVSLMKDSVWNEGKTIGSKVNVDFDEITGGLSPQGDQLLIFHNKYGDETLSYANYQGEFKFDFITDFGIPINQNGSEFGACYSSSSDTLFYAVEMEEGHTDIVYSMKLPDGTWAEPKLPKGALNSVDDENFPSLSADGRKMIFSSNRPGSMGGYDLFYSVLDVKTGEWGAPVNMGFPLNDTYDNFNISFPDDKRYGYVSAIRSDSRGLRDLYKVIFNDEEPPVTVFKYTLITDESQPEPDISVWDESGKKLIGTYKRSAKNNQFVVALEPGTFQLQVKVNGEIVFTESLLALDMRVDKYVVDRHINLVQSAAIPVQ